MRLFFREFKSFPLEAGAGSLFSGDFTFLLWQWYSPVFLFLWHPLASVPPECAKACQGINRTIKIEKTIFTIAETFQSYGPDLPLH